ncbi:MAG: radical SAM protein [Proteobacteria bacterium]|nr:radical SAM protein [Pseudomonadota bacterium]MDE3208652.1 radical SAM protein [Pseudomonadota bacterium]
MLSVKDHNRESAGLTYVYPVVSRRSGGLSVGINLNPNNACNWACVYCQVPNLTRGRAPAIDLLQLETELTDFLHEILEGRFLEEQTPQWARRLNDIALSGNGEPTTAKEFGQVVEIINKILKELHLLGRIELILITNGSQIHRPDIQLALKRFGELDGQIWFKLDRATPGGIYQVNGIKLSLKRVRENLVIASSLCTTWIQSCFFSVGNFPPAVSEQQAYLELLASFKNDNLPIAGVLLYDLARPSMQPDSAKLSNPGFDWMNQLASAIRDLGYLVKLAL